MIKYVKLDAVQKKIMRMTNDVRGADIAREVGKLPAEDVQEVRRGYRLLTDGTTGVCPFCNRQDHIDPLAKYCRYCGARLEIRE